MEITLWLYLYFNTEKVSYRIDGILLTGHLHVFTIIIHSLFSERKMWMDVFDVKTLGDFRIFLSMLFCISLSKVNRLPFSIFWKVKEIAHEVAWRDMRHVRLTIEDIPRNSVSKLIHILAKHALALSWIKIISVDNFPLCLFLWNV